MLNLQRNLLSVALASALTLNATGAHAQNADAGSDTQQNAEQKAVDLDTVTVTGIRRGIESAISVKQDATSIVEAISAEDIGKLPDSSIADSLARLPGISAQRLNISVTHTVDLPEPTGPMMSRTRASDCMNFSPVGGGL